jgi:hypothetical protein
MSAAHTPGPWFVVERPDPKMISSWVIQIGDQTISFFPYIYQFADAEKTCGGYIADHKWHANARLIASAPDLLKALNGCVEHMEHSTTHGREAYDKARAAIARATGEKT